MPFLGQHLRITWHFTVDATDEIAETSLNFAAAAPWAGAAAALAELDSIAVGPMFSQMDTLLGTGGLNWADYSRLASLKVAAIGSDGSYLAGADPLEVDGVPADHVGTASNTQPQDTVVISLRTDTDVGPGKRGRMYLPHTRLTLPAGFAITSSVTRDNIAVAAALFIHDVTETLNAGLTTVVGPMIAGQTGTGTMAGITRVRCGGVTDTQRRRRNAIPELYSDATIPPL